MTQPIITEAADGVLSIRFNRPDKKNALTREMYDSLGDALERAARDDLLRVVLFLGSDGVFTAGNDLGDFLALAENAQTPPANAFGFLEKLLLAEKPLVAGVDGIAVGVGTTMLFHCDYVVASEISQFRAPFVDLGILPEAGSTLLAPSVTGYQRAFALLAMGESFSARQAEAAGFVNIVTPVGQAEEIARAAAVSIAAKPARALAIARNLLRGDRTAVLMRMREEAELFAERVRSEEAKRAFAEFFARK